MPPRMRAQKWRHIPRVAAGTRAHAHCSLLAQGILPSQTPKLERANGLSKITRFYPEMCLNGVNTWVYSQGVIPKSPCVTAKWVVKNRVTPNDLTISSFIACPPLRDHIRLARRGHDISKAGPPHPPTGHNLHQHPEPLCWHPHLHQRPKNHDRQHPGLEVGSRLVTKRASLGLLAFPPAKSGVKTQPGKIGSRITSANHI